MLTRVVICRADMGVNAQALTTDFRAHINC